MATITETRTEWTAADLSRRFGPMPLHRFRFDPAPGTATEEDVIAIREREKRLYELVDVVLVEKTMGWPGSYIAGLIVTLLNNFVRHQRLGIVVGADGMYRLNPDLVRIPDVSFLSRDRIPGRRMPKDKVCRLIPNLAVEVLSESNTKKEMAEKLHDSFGCSVELVWYVDPAKKNATVYTAPDQYRLVRESQTLDGGAVLPELIIPLRELFADPIA